MLLTMAEASDRLTQLFAVGILPAPAPPAEPDLWDDVIGIPIDAWVGATTSRDMAALIEARERGDFLEIHEWRP